MYDQLEGLWKRLGVGEADMDAFVEAHRGSTEETVREYEEELERMLELKRERMGVFVQSAREEIMKLWDDLMVGNDERADFAPFADGEVFHIKWILEAHRRFVDEHTEELLTIHEDEIRRLKEERRMKAPLLASIKKYFDICEEEKELAAAASDQTRLLGRGRDPGRLLREEKMRKRVSKEKPRVSCFFPMSTSISHGIPSLSKTFWHQSPLGNKKPNALFLFMGKASCRSSWRQSAPLIKKTNGSHHVQARFRRARRRL